MPKHHSILIAAIMSTLVTRQQQRNFHIWEGEADRVWCCNDDFVTRTCVFLGLIIGQLQESSWNLIMMIPVTGFKMVSRNRGINNVLVFWYLYCNSKLDP